MRRTFSASLDGPIKLLVRRYLSRYVHWRLRTRQSPWPDRPTGSATLIFAPHQDDESLGCGGLISRRVAAGDQVYVAYLTDGAGSHPGHPSITPAELAGIRAREARAATALLGVPAVNLFFFHAPDGRLPHLSPAVRIELVEQIRLLITRLQPSQILITAAGDGSTEHHAANQIVRDALASNCNANPRLLEYPVWSRWNPLLLRKLMPLAHTIHLLTLTPQELSRKRAAIHAHHSQVEPLPPWSQPVLSADFLSFFQDEEEFYFEF